MASHARDLPARSGKRCAQADRSFGRRAFLVTLLALLVVALVTFAAIHLALRAGAKTGVLLSLRETLPAVEPAGRNLRALAWISANPAIGGAIVRAGKTHRPAASRKHALQTLQKIARSAREVMRCDVAAVTGAHGRLLAVAPGKGPEALLFAGSSRVPGPGVWDLGGTIYTVTTTPVRLGGRRIGELAVGARFDLEALHRARLGPVALLHAGRVVRSTFSPAAASRIHDLPPVCFRDGCELRLNGEDFWASPISHAPAEAGFAAEDQLIGFRSIDAAVDQITRGYRMRLLSLGVAITLLAFCLAVFVSHVLSRPLHLLVARLNQSQAAGRWDADFPEDSTTREVNLLAAAINRAAVAVANSNERLDQVSVDFVETMAQALDARDPCTAGHSKRVSDYATAIATTMRLSPGEIETIRLGARLHDIGKIGISDTVLRKAGSLTPEEYGTIKLHPRIGRKILERVAAFEPYLPLVELHHEDFDGRGYPYGLKGHEVPLAVRIVRVADVFDALTTDRAYRQSMPIDRAYQLIASHAGEKFDPDVVRALRAALGSLLPNELTPLESLARLALS